MRILTRGNRCLNHINIINWFISKTRVLLFFLLILFAALICVFFQIYNGSRSIKLNEICSNNASVFSDLYDGADYIELYNESWLSCRLNTLYLSDDLEDLKKVSLSDYRIVSRGYNVVWLNQINDFAIDKMGDNIYLSDASGRIIDTVSCPKLERDTSYARIGETWEVRRPTPGGENNVESVILEQPVFSAESGFYDQEFELEVLSDLDKPVYYTLDGSEPNRESYLYSEPIRVYDKSRDDNVFRSIKNVIMDWDEYEPDQTPVEKAFIIKAKVIDSDGNYSDTICGTYFIGRDKERDIISIIGDTDDLFGESGIYVTGKVYDDWYMNTDRTDSEPSCNFELKTEIPADLFFFENGEMRLCQNIGLRIQGASDRYGVLKRFSLFAREKYDGNNRFEYAIVDDRNGHSYFTRCAFADMFVQSLVKDRNVAVADTRPVSVFLNGEYWYEAYLTERLDTYFFEDKYDVFEDDVWIAKNEAFDEKRDLYLGNPYDHLIVFARDNDLSIDNNYNVIGNMMDIQSYIDYACINIYCANEDVSPYKNCVMWRAEKRKFGGYSDGKWRWALYDMDAIEWNNPQKYNVEHGYEINTFSQRGMTVTEAFDSNILFDRLKANKDFCRQFVLTFMDLVNDNFGVENVTRELEKHGKDISWNDNFFLKRADYMIPALADEFDLKYEVADLNIKVNEPEMGYIRINTIEPEMDSDGRWKGIYFGDYPVEVIAIANPGYEFVEWKGDTSSLQTVIEVDLSKGDKSIEALFRKIN